MRSVAIWMSRLLEVVFRRQRDARLDEEIAEHLAHLRAEHERRGLSPAEALLAARRSFGGVDQAKQRYRDQRGWPSLESLLQDVRFAARHLARHRSSSLPLVAVLALGLGVGHMFFTLTYAHTMRGLPIDGVDRVFVVSTVDPQGRDQPLSYPDFEDARAAQRTFDDLAAYVTGSLTLNVADQVPDRLAGTFTTASGFAAAGVRPVLGRLFSTGDEAPGAPTVVLLTERIWRGRFAADPAVLGREVLVNGAAATIVGVIPDKSGFPSAAAVFLPLAARPDTDRAQPAARPLQAFGRLAPGVTLPELHADLDAIAASMAGSRPATNTGVRLRATAINQRLVGGRIGGWLPFITAGLIVVAVASTNAGNLVLAAAAARAREVAIRTSLGASRVRVVRQLLVESVLFAAVAAVLGLTLSRAGVALHASAIPPDSMPYWFDYSVDRTVFAWLWLIALAMVIVFALVPAWQASRVSAVAVLNDGGRAGTGRGHLGASLFLAVQVGLAVVLVTQVGVAALTGTPRLATDRLLEDDRVLTGSVTLPADRYATAEARREFRQRVADQLRAVPGITAVAFASSGPMEGSPERQLLIEGRDEAATAPRAHVLEVDPGYFRLLGAGAVRGRDFGDRDGAAGPRVAIVNERAATLHFPAIDPIGQRIALVPPGDTSAPAWATIVGIVPDIRHREGSPAATAIVYLPLAAGTTPTVALLARGASAASALTPAVREAMRRVDPFVPLARARSLPAAVRDGTWVGRTSARLANTVCLAAFAMAAFGLFAVVSHRMALRRREIGLRMALGADGRRIAGVVVGSVGRALGAGVLLGVLGVVAWDRAFAPADAEARGVSVVSGTLAALTAVVLLGCAVPVIRALRIAPAEALRRE
jgi:putative ABC transport system permease protein